MDIGSKNTPEGYRHIYDRTILDYYLQMDMNGDVQISKNEWMIANLQLLAKDIDYLEKQGPDAIMKFIKDFSDEFDSLDKDSNKYIEFADFKEKVKNSIYIEED